MSILETKKIEPATGTTVTLGAAGETVAISASQLKTKTIKLQHFIIFVVIDV